MGIGNRTIPAASIFAIFAAGSGAYAVTQLGAGVVSSLFTIAAKGSSATARGATRQYAAVAQCAVLEFKRTYIRKGVRKGVTKLAEVVEGGGMTSTIPLPPTWLTVYQTAIPLVMSLPVQDLPDAWVKQGTKMLSAMQPLEIPQKRQDLEVWEQLAKLKMPRPQRDFVRKALWKKLTVGDRTQKAYHQLNCNMCSVPETIKHVLSGCKFWSVACDIVTKTFGPVWGPTGVMCPMKRLLVDQPLLSLQATQGPALWAVARAGCVLRCEVRFRSVNSSLSDFISAWTTIVHTWVSAAQTSFVREEASHLCKCLNRFQQGHQIFLMVQARGAVVRCKAAHVPQKQRWVTENVQLGWDVAYVDGSKKDEGGG